MTVALTACHHVIGSRTVPPDMFLAAIVRDGAIGIARTDSVESCARGEGDVRFLPLEGARDVAEEPFLSLRCSEVHALPASEIALALHHRGYRSGRSEMSANKRPIVDHHRGFVELPGEWISTEYYLRLNDTYIQLVRWSGGNHWGTEAEHVYRVLDTTDRIIRTARSEQRDVELD